MKLGGILFDFNGTLIFDSHMHIEAFKRLLPLYGTESPEVTDMVGRILGRTNRDIYSSFVSPRFTDEELSDFILAKERLYFDSCLSLGEGFRLAEGVPEMLDFLSDKGIPFCLATGSERMNMEFYMEHLGLGRWFEFGRNIVYEDGSFAGKPAPDIYLLAAEKLGLAPSRCLVFEDGTNGILAARRAGVGAVVAVYEKGLPSPLTEEAHADLAIHDHLSWKNTLADYGFMR